MSVQASRSAWIAPIVLLLFAIAVRGIVIWRTGFDGLYGQDPFAYFDYSVDLKTALTQGQLPPPFFWPIGYPGLVVALSIFLPLPIAALMVSIVSSALVAVLTFLIVREILSDQPNATIAALCAGGIVASAGRLLISSVSVMSDAAGLFWATLSAYSVIRYQRTHRFAWLAVVGFALGWAVTTRWVYAFLFPVWIIVLVGEKSQTWKVWTITTAFILLALLPQEFLIANYASQGNIAFVGDAQVYSWNPLYAFQSNIVNPDGHFTYSWAIGNFYTLPLIHLDYVPIWFTPLVLLGVWVLLRQRAHLILLLGWFVVMWGFLIGVPWENWRFPLVFFPPLAILVGIGLHNFMRRVTIRSARFIGIWLSICFVATIWWGLFDAESFIAHQLDERAVVNWVVPQLPSDATILTFNETATLAHFTPFRVIELASETPESVERIARQNQDVFVVLNIENIESQWQGLAPQVNFQTLQNHFVLRTMATRGAYSLYAVGSER